MRFVLVLTAHVACLSFARRVQNSIAMPKPQFNVTEPSEVIHSQVLFASNPAVRLRPAGRSTLSRRGIQAHSLLLRPMLSKAAGVNQADTLIDENEKQRYTLKPLATVAEQKLPWHTNALSSVPMFLIALLSIFASLIGLHSTGPKGTATKSDTTSLVPSVKLSQQPCRRQSTVQMSAAPITDTEEDQVKPANKNDRLVSVGPALTDKNENLIPAGAPPATGTLLGAISLIAGTTVGAGILALPAKTFDAGFGPSAVTLLLCWVYMSASGLLIAEVNINTLCALEKSAVSFGSMAEETLGELGARVNGAAYVFIHYALLIAYILQGGSLLVEYLQPLLGVSSVLPPASGPLLFVLIAGGTILANSDENIESGNNFLFAGVIATFLALAALGLPNVDTALLARSNVGAVVPAIPVMVVSLVYHNVVPTVCYQLGCDPGKVRTAIIAGAGIPTIMFILWNLVILGSVPTEMAEAATGAGLVFDPLVSLRASGDSFGSVVRGFSLLAIITSFIGFVLGLREFFADTFSGPLGLDQTAANATENDARGQLSSDDSLERFTLTQRSIILAMTLAPPLAVALYDPSLFFAALDNAGTFGILILFGILPAAMAWQQRYLLSEDLGSEGGADLAVGPLLPGGRFSLALMIGGAATIIGLEIYERVSGILGG